MRGRSAPRAPRVTLSMEKESPESQAGESPPPPPYVFLLLLGKRSRSARPCPTGAKPHQARECLSRRQPPKVVPCRGSLLTTHKTSRGIPGFSIPPAGSLACGYHQYSSEYGAGTCPAKGRQGVRLLPPFPFGGDRRFLEPQAEKIDIKRGQRPLGRTPAAVRRVPWGGFRGHPLAIPLG